MNPHDPLDISRYRPSKTSIPDTGKRTMKHRPDPLTGLTQAVQETQRSSACAARATGLKWQARSMACGLALLAASASAVAQRGSAPSLACQPATVTVFPGCPTGHQCGPGDGPGMSQLLGSPSTNIGVTGAASARGTFLAATKTVDFSYSVPDVRAFAPAVARNQLIPFTTQTWIVKATAVPGALGSNFVKTHSASDFGTSQTGTTSTAGNTSTTSAGNIARWLLVGQVSGQAVIDGRFQGVTFGFSCDLPVQNMNLLQNPIYQPPITSR